VGLPIVARLVYTPRYDITFLGLERLHPFDSRKYSRAFGLLQKRLGDQLQQRLAAPSCEVGQEELRTVHTGAYLHRRLRRRRYLARALELPLLQLMPVKLTDRRVLCPMRWATRGTVDAARAALEQRLAINLAGGYHHASRDRGEGFCIYADVPVAVSLLRREGLLSPEDRLAYVDLDAHQGNGVERLFAADPTISIFDLYNRDIYPQDARARQRIDRDLPLPAGTSGEAYLEILRRELPPFLDQCCDQGPPRLTFYIAGSDVYRGDALGGLRLSAGQVLERDLLVAAELQRRELPWVMLLAGGYSEKSHRLVADSVGAILEQYS
jgi:histone deacetylase 11